MVSKNVNITLYKYKLDHFSFLFLKRFYLFYLLEKVGERERERNNVWLPLAHPALGAWPATQAYALDWESNQRPFDLQGGTLPLSYTSQGFIVFLVFLKT